MGERSETGEEKRMEGEGMGGGGVWIGIIGQVLDYIKKKTPFDVLPEVFSRYTLDTHKGIYRFS